MIRFFMTELVLGASFAFKAILTEPNGIELYEPKRIESNFRIKFESFTEQQNYKYTSFNSFSTLFILSSLDILLSILSIAFNLHLYYM